MNYEGTTLIPPKSTVEVICDDPNISMTVKFIEGNGTTGTSGSSGPSPIKDPMKGINKKYHYKGKYPKPR